MDAGTKESSDRMNFRKPRQRTPIRRKRERPRVIHPERSGGHKRERLHGAAREKRRAEIFERAGGRCEEMVVPMWKSTVAHLIGPDFVKTRCPNRATEWSHLKHGARKCDCMECSIASCHGCHVKRHNAGGKPIAVTKKSLKAAV